MERNQGLPTWKGAGWPHNRQAAGAEAGGEGGGGRDRMVNLMSSAISCQKQPVHL